MDNNPGGGSQNGHHGAELDVIYIALGIVLSCIVVYFFFRTEIIHGIFFIKHYELKLLGLFSDQYQPLLTWAKQASLRQITLSDIEYLTLDVGNGLKYAFASITGLLALLIIFLHPEKQFTGSESTKSLADKMRTDFPVLNVVQGLDLIKQPLHEGPWAMAQTPIEFGQSQHILFRDNGKIVVDRTRAKAVFSQQLGRPWPGVDKLLPYERGLFAVLATYIAYQRDTAEDVLEKISRRLTSGDVNNKKIDISLTEPLLAQYGHREKVVEITQQHHYVSTIFVSLLNQARTTGIVANASYLWLKPIDRTLWYVLNNVGRKAVFIEAAAIHSHWLAESHLQTAITEPMVDEVIYGLEEAVKSRIIKSL